MYSPTPAATRHRLRVLGGMAICVSSMFSVESFLTVCCERGRPQKLISGIFHNQEWQRFESLMCLLCDRKKLKAQIVDNALTFATRAKDGGESYRCLIGPSIDVISSVEDSPAAVKLRAAPGMFGKAPSAKAKATARSSGGKRPAIPGTIDWDDEGA